MKTCITLSLLFSFYFLQAQIPSSRITDWSLTGLKEETSIDDYAIISMETFNIDNTGSSSNNSVFTEALNSIQNNEPTILYFPEGDFFFDKTLNLPSNVIIKGQGASSTTFTFNLGGSGHAIRSQGTISSKVYNFAEQATKDDFTIKLDDVTQLAVGDWIQTFSTDADLMKSTWGHFTSGQIAKIESINGNVIRLESPLRRDYMMDKAPYIKEINPKQNVGIECIKIVRKDKTTSQSSNILFNYVVNSWVRGIESNLTNFGHIELRRSANVHVNKSYIHHGHDYGGGGKAYGVVMHFSTSECLIEDNVFEHLRHSILLQAGANGNAITYNYSFDPYWDQFFTNTAGELTLHGNYPYLNLFEQNIVQNIVIDNSHGANGPYNTFFRNRADGWGLVFSSTNSPNQNIVENDVSNLITGGTQYLVANRNGGDLTPQNTLDATESYIYQQIPDFLNSNQYGKIGYPNSLNVYTNPAYVREVEENDPLKNCCNTLSLPLDVVAFDVNASENKQVKVSFDVADIIDTDYILLEYSDDGINFQSIKSFGISKNELSKSFEYVHIPSYNTLHYYRLKIIDLNQSIAFSSIRSVYFNAVDSPLIINNNTLSISNISDFTHIIITNTNGEIVKRNAVQPTLELHSLPPGTYFVMLDGEKKRIVEKIILPK